MVRIQKQLVVKEDMEFGYGKVIQKRTVDDKIVDREYDRINAENIPAKNPIGSETNIQDELNSKLDSSLGDLRYALINGSQNEIFRVADPLSGAEAAPLGRVLVEIGKHAGDTFNPHYVTKDQVGLGNVDNTSDLGKPVSTATQTALDDKAPLAHVTDNSNPHSVTAVQAGADPAGSADAIQDNLDDHIAERETHGLTTLGDGSNYLSDDGTYKNISPITVHNQLTGRDGNDTHPIESITSLRSELDGKADGGDSFLKTEHIVATAGSADAGKPIVLDGSGQIDASLMGQGLYLVAMYTPDAANEYPDDTGENTGAFWGVEGVDATSGYTFTGGDLAGATVYNGDMVVRGEQEWGYRNFGNTAGLYLRLDGSNSMTADLPMGTNKIVNLSPATANGDAVEYSQIAGLTTSYLRLDGSTAMAGNLDIGGGVNKIINLVDDAINPTDVPNYGQLIAHEDNVSNPHQVNAAQVGAEPADPSLQGHLIETNNPHYVTASQINAEPADPAIQTHLDDEANPHAVTAVQAGALPIGGGTLTGDVVLERVGNTPKLIFDSTGSNKYEMWTGGGGNLNFTVDNRSEIIDIFDVDENGNVKILQDPINPNHAVHKEYVDATNGNKFKRKILGELDVHFPGYDEVIVTYGVTKFYPQGIYIYNDRIYMQHSGNDGAGGDTQIYITVWNNIDYSFLHGYAIESTELGEGIVVSDRAGVLSLYNGSTAESISVFDITVDPVNQSLITPMKTVNVRHQGWLTYDTVRDELLSQTKIYEDTQNRGFFQLLDMDTLEVKDYIQLDSAYTGIFGPFGDQAYKAQGICIHNGKYVLTMGTIYSHAGGGFPTDRNKLSGTVYLNDLGFYEDSSRFAPNIMQQIVRDNGYTSTILENEGICSYNGGLYSLLVLQSPVDAVVNGGGLAIVQEEVGGIDFSSAGVVFGGTGSNMLPDNAKTYDPDGVRNPYFPLDDTLRFNSFKIILDYMDVTNLKELSLYPVNVPIKDINNAELPKNCIFHFKTVDQNSYNIVLHGKVAHKEWWVYREDSEPTGYIQEYKPNLGNKVDNSDGIHGEIKAITKLTQTEYDNITPDSNTMYLIIG